MLLRLAPYESIEGFPSTIASHSRGNPQPIGSRPTGMLHPFSGEPAVPATTLNHPHRFYTPPPTLPRLPSPLDLESAADTYS